MHARDTPSRPRRTTSRTTTVDVSDLNRNSSAVLFDASPAGDGKKVDVGVDGWTPKVIKEMVLTPAHIRRANTFDPTTDRSEKQEDSSTSTKTARRRRSSSPAARGGAYQMNIAYALRLTLTRNLESCCAPD
eukprot:COSAG02_NODE_4700_length_5079_cov_1134.378112_3_plen_132_part_00